MAKGQTQGGAITAGLILFAALWLTSTVLLVMLYTDQAAYRDENARLVGDNNRLISRAERGSLPLFQSARPGGPTVVGLLERARAETAELATGDGSKDAAAVATALDDLLRGIRDERLARRPKRFDGVSYHEAVSMLYEDFKTESKQRVAAQERVAQLETEIDQLSSAVNEQKSEFDRQIKQFDEKLKTVESGRDNFRTEKNDEVTKLVADFEQRRKQNDEDLTRERRGLSSCREQVTLLEERLGAMADLLPGPDTLLTARQPDGRILHAIPGDKTIFIDRGRRHRLTLGLRFAVYESAVGIPVDGRSKGQIEVVRIDETSAQCKIIRVSGGSVIMEGDLIANPIYDPNRPVTFVVLGDFDLDHDGMMDRDGAAVVDAMIAKWGGSVTSELTALTDFVVLGAAPRSPRPARNESAEEAARVSARQRDYDRYMQTVSLSRSLAIPVLNQQVFLNFLGYSGG